VAKSGSERPSARWRLRFGCAQGQASVVGPTLGATEVKGKFRCQKPESTSFCPPLFPALKWEALCCSLQAGSFRPSTGLTMRCTVVHCAVPVPGAAVTQMLNSWVFQRLRRVQQHPIVTKGQEVQ